MDVKENVITDRLRIRPFCSGDQAAAHDLISTGLGEHFGFIDHSLNPDIKDIQSFYTDQGHTFLVAELDKELVGTGALLQENEGVGRLVRMSVKSEHRRKGIGHALARRLFQIARQQGLFQLLVETNNDWHDAIKFYLSYGFVECDQDEESTHMVLDL